MAKSYLVSQADKGQPSGVAALDTAGHVPQAQLLRSGSGLYALTQKASTRAIFSAQDRSALYDATTGNVVVMYLGDQRWLCSQTFNVNTKTRSEPVFITAARASLGFEDNHGVASIAMDANGYYHVVFGAHDLLPIYTRSTNPHDASSWTVPVALAVGFGTYHSIACDRTGNKLYVIFRAGSGGGDNHSNTYPGHEFAGLLTGTVAGDGTVTWAERAGGLVSTVPYSGEAKHDAYVGGCDFVGGRLHISMCVAHGPIHDSQRADVFHFVYDPVSDHVFNLAGSDQGTIVNTLAKLQACRVQQVGFVAGLRHAFKPDGTGVICWNAYDGGSSFINDVPAGASAADLNTHTVGGVTWARSSINDGTALLFDNSGIYTTSTTGIADYRLPYVPASADYAVEIDFSVLSVIANWFLNLKIRAQNDAGGSAYYANIDSTNTLSVTYRDSGSAAHVLQSKAATIAAGTTGTLRIECRGSWIWARLSMSDGTFQSVRFRDTNITAAGTAALRMRMGSVSTGVHVTAFRVMDKSAIQTWVGHWNGTDFATRNQQHNHNHAYHQPAVRVREDGGFEHFTVVGRTDEPVTTRSQETTPLYYLDAGADVGMLSSADGRTWTDKGVVIPRTLARGQYWQGGQVPLDAPREAKFLCLPSGIGYGVLDGYPTDDLGLYLWSDEFVDPLAAGRYWIAPGPVEQKFDPVTVLSAITGPTAYGAAPVDLATYVPLNCSRVLVKAFGIGVGTANTQTFIAVREFGTARNEDFAAIGNAADTFAASTLLYEWIPIGRNRMIDIKTLNLAANSFTFQIVGFR